MTPDAVASAYLKIPSFMTISNGADTRCFGMFPAMKMTEPYSPNRRAQTLSVNLQYRGPQHRQESPDADMQASAA